MVPMLRCPPLTHRCRPQKQLNVLQSHYPLLSASSRSHMLTAYVKFSNLFPEMRAHVQQVRVRLVRRADTFFLLWLEIKEACFSP